MSSRIRSLALALAAVLALAAPLAAAEAPAPKMFIVHTETTVPSQLALYEQGTRDFIAMVQKNRAMLPDFSFTALRGEDLSYSYVSPIRGFADLTGISRGIESMMMAGGEAAMALAKNSAQSMTRFDDRVFEEMADASYWPAKPHVSPQEATYYELDFYRVVPGMELEATKIAAEWKALYASKNLPYGYSVYRLVLGDDGPLVLVSIPAKSEADLAAIKDASAKALGDAFRAQMAKTLAITRAFEAKRFEVRPDLSLMPAAGKGR